MRMRIPVHEWSGVTWVVGGWALPVTGSFSRIYIYVYIIIFSFRIIFFLSCSVLSHVNIFLFFVFVSSDLFAQCSILYFFFFLFNHLFFFSFFFGIFFQK